MNNTLQNMEYQDYLVIACYGRRRQKEANEARLQALHPTGQWTITAACTHEFRVYRQVANEHQTLKEIRQESANRMWSTKTG